MKIIAAQGNPGTQYRRTRHNVGFMVLDALAEAHNVPWKQISSPSAQIAEFTEGDEKILLVKPLSFYNETGPVVAHFARFYKVSTANDVLVIHDELALPFGTIRVRSSGSDAGNNGIKSLNNHLGAAFWRIRIGIWNEDRERIDDVDFVINAFNPEEKKELPAQIKKASALAESFVHGELLASTH